VTKIFPYKVSVVEMKIAVFQKTYILVNIQMTEFLWVLTFFDLLLYITNLL